MSSVGGYLFGTSPKVVQEPAPAAASAVSPAQQGTQGQIASILATILNAGGYPGRYTGTGTQPQFAAPITPQQTSLIDTLFAQAQPGSQVANTQANALTTLNQLFNTQPMSTAQAFNAIAQPLQQTFAQQTLPAIDAAAATSAGGKEQGGSSSVGLNGQINTATQNLTSSEANAAAGLQYQSNQSAITNILNALGLTPAVTGAPTATAGAALGAAGLPQQTQQTQLSGQYQNFVQTMQSFLQMLGLGAGFSTSTDMAFPQGNTAVLPGTEGLVNELLQAAVSSYAKSDRRLKQNIVLVGKRNGLGIYQFEYIGQPNVRFEGVMADEVKAVYPNAVMRGEDGYDRVDYSQLGFALREIK